MPGERWDVIIVAAPVDPPDTARLAAKLTSKIARG